MRNWLPEWPVLLACDQGAVMNMPIHFNTLEYARKLSEGGLPPDLAETHAQALAEVLHEATVTPGDLLLLKTDLLARIDILRNEMLAQIGALRTEMQTQIAALRTEMLAQIATLRSEMQSQIATLRSEMRTCQEFCVPGSRFVVN
ncbi:hypothetical protein [Duganella qianjiadongensis]|uniref:DUF1640 domain-containing protein n=1 Tax=Duganella qianjiadongensis TaxID=2692176 RepID=A0ABW9VQV1_9BURK|nr:hypothetical protein [Duganella qianjiadongensis]MYM41808.1 hypothetical protein [Duganella qianjiadongensis]